PCCRVRFHPILTGLLALPTLRRTPLLRTSGDLVSPMHILIISLNYAPRRGGIEYLMTRLYRGLKEKNSVQLITTRAHSTHLTEEGVFRAPLPGLIGFALYT